MAAPPPPQLAYPVGQQSLPVQGQPIAMGTNMNSSPNMSMNVTVPVNSCQGVPPAPVAPYTENQSNTTQWTAPQCAGPVPSPSPSPAPEGCQPVAPEIPVASLPTTGSCDNLFSSGMWDPIDPFGNVPLLDNYGTEGPLGLVLKKSASLQNE